MGQRLKKLWRRLDRRLILLTCLMVIPINVLAIVFSTMAVNASNAQVLQAQTGEFRRLAGWEREKISTVENWLVVQIEADLRRMASPSQFSAVYSIVLANQMGGALDAQEIRGFGFVREHQEDEKLYVKGSSGQVGIAQSPALRAELMDAGLSGQGVMSFIGGSYYYTAYSFRNYTIGFAVDLEKELARWRETLPDCALAVSDGTGIFLADESGLLARVEGLPGTAMETAAVGALTISLLPSSGVTVPTTHIWLQALAWGSLVLLRALWLMIRRHVITPIRTLQTGMEQLEGDVGYRIGARAHTEDFEYLYLAFNKMAEDIQRSHEKDIQLYESQLNNLKLQVNPHMLLNSLTMIYSLAETKQYMLIQQVTMSLVGYFRYCLRENNTLVPLRSELRFVEDYIGLQKMRFPGELSSSYLVQDGLEDALIPPLLIQNFVENAAKYARVPDKTIEILIWVRKQGEAMYIDIADTGKGMDGEILERLGGDGPYTDHNGVKHIGIWNCRRRLEAFFGGTASLSMTSAPGEGTTVQLALPLRYQEEGQS